MKAFENVRTVSDWQKPTGPAAKGWESKVQWALLDAYDVLSLEGENLSIKEVDSEAAQRIGEQHNLARYLDALSKGPPAIGALPKAVLAMPDDS